MLASIKNRWVRRKTVELAELLDEPWTLSSPETESLPSSIELIRSAKLRALAVTSATPAEALPGIPTVGEYVTDFEATAWYGLGAPTKTPSEIVQKLNVATNAALGDAAIKKRLTNLGGNVIPGPPTVFGKLVDDDIVKWGRLIKAAGNDRWIRILALG